MPDSWRACSRAEHGTATHEVPPVLSAGEAMSTPRHRELPGTNITRSSKTGVIRHLPRVSWGAPRMGNVTRASGIRAQLLVVLALVLAMIVLVE